MTIAVGRYRGANRQLREQKMGVEGMQKVRSLNDRDTSLDIPKSGNGNDLIQYLHKRADIFRGITLDGTGLNLQSKNS